MKFRLTRPILRHGLLCWLLALPILGRADGIPEPSLVLYGVVSNASAGGGRLTFGSFNWVFRPADGGASITLTGVLTNINDQFSYVIRVPCETELPGLPISAGTLKLAASPTRYDRSQVTVDGVAATFKQPALTNLVLARTDRGRIERVDLTVGLDVGSGLPEAWQIQYFGRTGVNPQEDADSDGLSNLAEFKAGTNPTDAQSRFEIMDVLADSVGGIRVEWSSAAGKFYTLQRSGDLLSGFNNLQTQIAGTPPRNTVRDATATGDGPYFYRLRVDE